MNKAVFLDRDGVLNHDHGYTYRVEDLDLLPGVGESLKLLKNSGYILVVITNQSGIARGLYTFDDVYAFHEAMQKKLDSNYGVKIDEFFICPHHTKGTVSEYAIPCNCRKPHTELPEQAIKKYHIDTTKSFFIGDKNSDMECAKNLSVTGIQVMPDGGSISPCADYAVKSLEEALKYIL